MIPTKFSLVGKGALFYGLFSFSYNKPGPGVSPDTPRKRGVARLLEVLGRDMGPFFKAGFLAVLGALPYIVGVALSVMTHPRCWC